MTNESEYYKCLQAILNQTRSLNASYGQICGVIREITKSPVDAALNCSQLNVQMLANLNMVGHQHWSESVSQTVLSSVGSLHCKMPELQDLEASRNCRRGILAIQSEAAAMGAKLRSPSAASISRLGLTQTAATSMAWDIGVGQLHRHLEAVQLLSRRKKLALRLLPPSGACAAFIEKAYRRIESSDNPRASKALELAKEQLLTTTDALIEIAVVLDDTEVVSPSRELLLPTAQQAELLRITESENEDDETIIGRSILARTASEGRLAQQLINHCNELALVSGKKAIFTPTTRLMEAVTDLPWLTSQNRQELAEIVDCFFFIFYEGAGSSNLRFTIAHGGVLTDAECTFVWFVKHLRNKWLRHDINHGKETEVEKSWATLSQTFKHLGLNHAPIIKPHFIQLHQRLLQEAIVFLTTLRDKLITA